MDSGLDPDPKSWWRFPDDNVCPDPGWRIFTPGDLDGDGVSDIAISRYSINCFGSPRQGVIIISGKTRGALYSLEREPRTQ